MTGDLDVVLCWAVATPPEFRALRRMNQLNVLVRREPFLIYTDVSRSQWAICTGIGVGAMSMGVGFLAGCLPPQCVSVWANFGVAGSRDLDLGSSWGVVKIVDENGGRAQYPGLLPLAGLSTAFCKTVGQVENNYPDNTLYDMEALGFFESAKRLTHVDGVAVLKVVSDNRNSGADGLNGKKIEDFILDASLDAKRIGNNLTDIGHSLAERLAPPDRFNEALAVHAFTTAQEIRLRKLLIWAGHMGPDFDPLAILRTSTRRNALDELEQCLEKMRFEVNCD